MIGECIMTADLGCLFLPGNKERQAKGPQHHNCRVSHLYILYMGNNSNTAGQGKEAVAVFCLYFIVDKNTPIWKL
jgi:hypothetical protein